MRPLLFSQNKQPGVSIELDHSNDYSKHSYSTQDRVQGKVILRFHEDTIIDSLNISFEGQCVSSVTSLQPWARQVPSHKTIHTFLVMQQPIKYETFPSNHLAKSGATHEVSFCFTVPATLLPYACEHGLDQESPLSQAHRQPPPSLGTPKGREYVKDLAPEYTRVEYKICACLKIRSSRHESVQPIKTEVPIRIEPTFEPNPPLVIEDADPDYQLDAAADFSWGTLRPSSSDGRLALHTRQPSPLQVTRARDFESSSIPIATPTSITTHLQFVPRDSLGAPPQLESVKIGLRAFTYSAAVPFSETPRSSRHNVLYRFHNVCSKLVDLGTHLVGDLVWEKCCVDGRSATLGGRHGCEFDPQQDSTEQNTSRPSSAEAISQTCPLSGSALKILQHIDSSQTASATATIYQTSLDIPINLLGTGLKQNRLVLVPTFSSCFVGRNYSLELTYTFRRSSSAPSTKTPDGLKHCHSPQSSDVCSNTTVSGIASKPRILSRPKKVKLVLPLQITSDNRSIHNKSRLNASSTIVDTYQNRSGTRADPILPARLELSSSSHTGKATRKHGSQNDRNESPPSYYLGVRSR